MPDVPKHMIYALYDEALSFRNTNTHSVKTYDEFKKFIKDGGFVKCGWDGNNNTENKIKQETNATIRCIPINKKQSPLLKCIYTNNDAKHEVIFAKAY